MGVYIRGALIASSIWWLFYAIGSSSGTWQVSVMASPAPSCHELPIRAALFWQLPPRRVGVDHNSWSERHPAPAPTAIADSAF